MGTEVASDGSDSKKHRIQFLTCLIVTIVVISLALKYDPVLINYFPAFFLVFFALMYAFSKIHRLKLFQPFEYLYPSVIILSISFAIISFTIGLHSDVFVTYDKDDSNTGVMKLFEADKILNFPLRQLNFKQNPLVKTIDFTALKDTTPTCDVIIVDKTASVINPGPMVSDTMLRRIKKKFNLDWEINGKYDVSELMPPFLVCGLVENQKQSAAHDYVGIYYYTGYDANDVGNLESINVGDHITDLTGSKYQKTSFMHDYFQSNSNFIKGFPKTIAKGSKQKTSFNDIVKSLNELLKNDDFTGKKINVSIISDFINTDPGDPIPDFSKISQIKNLNLYVLNGNDHGYKKNPPTILIKKMISSFSLLHLQTIIDFKEVNFENLEEAKLFYNELSIPSMQVIDKRANSSIYFFTPYKDFNTNQEAETKINFKDVKSSVGNPNESQYSFKIADLDNQTAHFPILYNTNADTIKKTTYSEEVFNMKIGPKDTLTLYLPYTLHYKEDRLFIDLISHPSNKRDIQSVSIKPLLSKTTSFNLLVFYTMFVVSICLILILPNLYVLFLILHGHTKCRAGHFLALAFPIAIGLVSLGYYGILLGKNGLIYLAMLGVVLIMMLLVTIPSFIAVYREETESEKKPYIDIEFHVLGTLVTDYKYLFKIGNNS